MDLDTSLVYQNASGCKKQESQLISLIHIFTCLVSRDQRRHISRVSSLGSSTVSSVTAAPSILSNCHYLLLDRFPYGPKRAATYPAVT